VGRLIDIVVNPNAGAGRAGRTVGEVVRELTALDFEVVVHPTERPGHAGEIVRNVLKSGKNTVIGVMGGDGSFHEALEGLHDGSGRRTAPADVTFALLPAGTGGDLRRTLNLPETAASIARFISNAKPTPFDLGEVAFVRPDGTRGVRWFGNVASFGMSGVIDQLVNAGGKWLGGTATFYAASLRASVAYKNVPVKVTVDGQVFYQGPVLNVAVANGRAFGGGMFIAPNADPHDGLLDVVVLGDLTWLESFLISRHLYKGMHIGRRHVLHTRGRTIQAVRSTWRDALLDVDGETPGKLDASFRVLPGAIRLLERA
jgi:diacylglycerol kinase (ATP)